MSAATSVQLRPASSDDSALLQLWDEERGQHPDWRGQLIAEADGKPVGFIQIIDPAREDSHNWSCVPADQRAIEIWIADPAELDQGYGTAMMKLAIKICFADPAVSAVLVDPPVDNPRAQRFYERLGFEFVVRRRCGEDDCFVYRLTRPAAASGTRKSI